MIECARQVVEREAQAVAALAQQFDAALEQVLSLLLDCRGHVLVVGVGTSAAMAHRFAHLLSCCGTPALFFSASDGIHGGAGAVRPEDVVYVISKGGESDEVNAFVQIARQRGARIVAQTEAPGSFLASLSDAVLCVRAAPDVDPFGLIATGSSLVNGAACDALCVLLLEQRGYTREGFAVTHPGGAVGKRLAAEQALD